jgi:NAD(P)-dependent dehydrogenase (short-subunit alcohol dehydrogenase family)
MTAGPGNVLVAGATGGIGSACVDAVNAAGGTAFGVDRTDFDITVPGGADDAVRAAVAGFGRLDGVVHAVGMSGRRYGDGSIATCTDEAWAEVYRVNLESAFRLLRAAVPVLTATGGGSIVLIGSALASTPDADFRTVAYSSAKGALTALTRVVAHEGAAAGVRVNLVSAGLVSTPMAERALTDVAIRSRIPELMPLGARACTPDEIASAVLWLLSPGSGRTTGAVVPVDGGWHL